MIVGIGVFSLSRGLFGGRLVGGGEFFWDGEGEGGALAGFGG